jgi:hypothetical protein
MPGFFDDSKWQCFAASNQRSFRTAARKSTNFGMLPGHSMLSSPSCASAQKFLKSSRLGSAGWVVEKRVFRSKSYRLSIFSTAASTAELSRRSVVASPYGSLPDGSVAMLGGSFLTSAKAARTSSHVAAEPSGCFHGYSHAAVGLFLNSMRLPTPVVTSPSLSWYMWYRAPLQRRAEGVEAVPHRLPEIEAGRLGHGSPRGVRRGACAPRGAGAGAARARRPPPGRSSAQYCT